MNKELATAYQTLQKVYFEGAYASIELNKVLNDSFNKALVTKITYGVLENDIYLQYVVGKFVSKPAKPAIMLLLKMATYTLYNVASIPPFALTNECVELAKKQSDKYTAGFVNAVIKNIIKTPVQLPNPKVNFAKYASIKYSYPMWYVERLLRDFDKAFVEQLLAFKPTTDTHIRLIGAISPDSSKAKQFINELTSRGIRYDCTPVGLNVDYNALLKYPELTKYYVVQGVPSIVTALSVGAKAGDKVLDATSAPGGKACLIAGLEPSIRVTACDLHIHRVGLIRAYAQSLGLSNVAPLMCDATKYNKDWQNAFDCVLCDVPCSGMGVVTKKPDILLNREPQDIAELAGLQYQILCNNAQYVRSGGTLVYSTCSILPEENEQIITKFLRSHPEFERQAINTFGLNVTNKDNMYTFYPHLTGTEGFFICRMVRK